MYYSFMIMSGTEHLNMLGFVGSVFETDPVLDFYVSDPLLEQLYECCKTTPDPSYLVSADFTNLMQLNDIIGRQKANEVMRTIAAIYQNTLATLPLTTRVSFRVHGDGINWVLEGKNLSQEQVRACLTAAEKETQTFIEQAGLSRIQHKRYTNVAGVGLATSFSEINRSSGTLTDIRNEHAFELSMARNLVANTVKNPLAAPEFLHEHYLACATKALEAWSHKRISAPSLFPENFTVQPIASKHTRSRREEMAFLKQIQNNGQATLIRFNLYNLGGLNSLIGNDQVDGSILEPVRDYIRQQLASFPPEYRHIYERDGGVMDIIVPTQNEWLISELQRSVQTQVTTHIFGKSVTQFTKDNDLEREDYDLAGDTLLANIPHKRGRLPGTGMISIAAPIIPQTPLDNVFQSLEAQQRLQEYHGIRYFERISIDSTDVRGVLITQSSNSDLNAIHPSAARLPGAEQNPYSWALANRFTQEQLADLLKKPVGMIYEALTGIPLQPVLNRQEIIFHLIDQGVDPARIKQHLSPRAAFDAFVRREMQEKKLRPVDIADRPSTRPHGHPEFLTFNLARTWGYIPAQLEGIDETLLQAQATIRTLGKLDLYKKGFRNVDSPALLPDIRRRAHTILADAESKTDVLRRSQLTDHVIEIARHEQAMPDPQIVLAGHSLVIDSMARITEDLERFDLFELAHEMRNLTAPLRLGNRKLESANALAILSRAAGLDSLRTTKQRHYTP